MPMLAHLPPTLAVYLDALNPVAFHIPLLGIAVRWYGISYLVGFLLGYLLILRVARVGISSVKPTHVGDLVVTLAIGVVVGGRAGYVLLYKPDLLWSFSSHIPWWDALAINHGGMASHGGMIGTVVAAWVYARRHGHRPLFLFDLMAFGAPLGLMCGRIANFINGELIGRVCSPTFPLATKFPEEIFDWPADKLQTLQSKLLAVGLSPWEGGRDGARWIVDQVHQHNQQVIDVLRPMLLPRHPSQLYAAAAEGLGVFLVLLIVWARPRRPGAVAAWFCFTYAAARISDEYFRRPDPFLMQDEFAWTGHLLTRGQLLSIILALVGVIVMVASRRTAAPKMGGWRRIRTDPVSTTTASPSA